MNCYGHIIWKDSELMFFCISQKLSKELSQKCNKARVLVIKYANGEIHPSPLVQARNWLILSKKINRTYWPILPVRF